MSKRTGRKPKRTSRRRTRRHSSTSETESVDEVPVKTRASSKVDETEKKVALTIKLPKPDADDCNEDSSTGMWKVECSNGSDGDIQKLKISLRRSPKDLLREQAAEAKYAAAAGKKEKEEAAGSSSLNSSVLDGSVSNYLEQFGSTVANDEDQADADSNEQADAVCSLEASSFSQEIIIREDDVHTDSGDMIPQVTPQQQDLAVENTNIDNNKLINIVETNEVVEDITEKIMQVQPSETPSLSEQSSLVTLQSNVSECILPEPVVEDKSVESISLPTVIEESQEPPVQIQEVVPETTDGVLNDLNTSVLPDETVQKSVSDEVQIEEFNKTDPLNDSEQMEDVVQLTVGSPDLVDEEEAKTVEETSHLQPSDTLLVKQDDIIQDSALEDKQMLGETPKLISTHPKRKWGSCKTRIPITISPFTLGTIIESNGDSIGDNGEYRSEEGEIQKTDTEEEHIDEEAMDINDTMLIDIEAVDYEAPEEEEKAEHEDSKSEKSNEEELIDKEPKKKTPTKRTTTTNIIHISNLVRPFTVGQLRDLLQRTGKIVPNGFWIDAIKSQCIVEYENEDQAVETVYALNESQWPSTNPKFLKVIFTNKEELNKALNGTYLDQSDRQKVKKVEKLRVQVDNHNIILREWDRGKLEDMNGEDDKSNKRKLIDDNNEIKEKKTRKDGKDSPDKRKKSKSKTPERVPTKSLDELFRKTKTTPTLYWSPLSAEQIAEKEDQRRKHLADIERSQKTNRRRRDNNHYPRRR